MNAGWQGGLEIQTQTGWGQVLAGFAAWCQPQPGWLALDVGCGPGLLPALLAQRGCRAYGADLDGEALAASRLHASLLQADALLLPFTGGVFDLVTASNLLFLLPEPAAALREMRRLLKPGGQIAVLNPSEQMSVAAAAALAQRRGLQGAARQSLLDWAARAEAHRRWGEEALGELFAAAGLKLVRSELRVGAGLARLGSGSVGVGRAD